MKTYARHFLVGSAVFVRWPVPLGGLAESANLEMVFPAQKRKCGCKIAMTEGRVPCCRVCHGVVLLPSSTCVNGLCFSRLGGLRRNGGDVGHG